MPKYDLNDPTDLDIMRGQFDMITHEEWEDYVELANERDLGYKSINILERSIKMTGMAKFLSPKVISWVLSLVEQLDEEVEEDQE